MPEKPVEWASSKLATPCGTVAATPAPGVATEMEPRRPGTAGTPAIARQALFPPKSLLDTVINLDVEEQIHPRDSMFKPNSNRQHYFSVGRSALMNIISSLTCRLSYGGGEAAIDSILDYGCGYGRVARYLRAGFPNARLDVTDINREGATWCEETFGASDVVGEIAEDQYDLIWLGSVFTHLSEALVAALLPRLKLGLRRNGILIFTTQGALSAFNLDHFARGDIDRHYLHYGLSKEAAAAVVADYKVSGYGYHDYPSRHGYGLAIGTPAWYISRSADETTLLLMAQERAWDNHQDVLAFLRLERVGKVPRGRLFSGNRDGGTWRRNAML
jgi:SAM-dependent methyltransferase